MKELIEALQLLSKYEQPEYPFHCEHDVLYVYVDPEKFTKEELETLYEKGFFVEDDHFESFKYGSC